MQLFILLVVFNQLSNKGTALSSAHYSLEINVRRVGVPAETIQLEFVEEGSTACTSYCYSRKWCTGFNIKLATKECFLFGHESLLFAPILPALGYVYGHKTTSDITKTTESTDYINCENSATSIVWQGQCFDRFAISPTNFDTAVATCKQKNSILAVMISEPLKEHFSSQMPYAVNTLIGLLQKVGQPAKDAGWYWFNSETNATADIDTENTTPVEWWGAGPDDWQCNTEADCSNQQCGSMGSGAAMTDAPCSHKTDTHTICQICAILREFCQEKLTQTAVCFKHRMCM